MLADDIVVSYGCRSVADWVCKCCTWMCDPLVNCGFFFCLDEEETDKGIVGVKCRSGDGGGRTILSLPFPTFITLKGHSGHPASSSPVVLWQAQTLHNLVAPRFHHSSHYLANPIPFDLCSWCALFTIGIAPPCAWALVKEISDQKSEWMTEGGGAVVEAKTEPDTSNKETLSWKRQSGDEWNNIGETRYALGWCTAIKCLGHLQTKINWPLSVSTPWPTPLLLPH